MRTQKIDFPTQQVACVFPQEPADLGPAFSELHLKKSYPVIVLIGGQIDAPQADATRQGIQTIARIAHDMNALVICGGTDMGVMAEIGQVRSKNSYSFPLVGITPEQLVTWKDGPSSTKFLWWGNQRWQLEPHYTHCILVPGSKFGDESPWIGETAALFSRGHRSVTVLINGGAALLDRRPDIRAAEQRLVAANAQIGEAKALLYPRFALTAQGGLAREDLEDLLDASSGFWDLGVALLQPIFNGGRLRANVRATESRPRQAVILYLQTLQTAFREVSDALVGYRKLREFREQQEILTNTRVDQQRLSNMRCKGGVTAYLEVLDTDRQLFDAQLGLAQAQRNEVLALVALYRALGGGWVDPAPAETPPPEPPPSEPAVESPTVRSDGTRGS